MGNKGSSPGNEKKNQQNDATVPQSSSSFTKRQQSQLSQCSSDSSLHIPKHLMWSCTTPEAHYEYIKHVCKKVKDLHGEEGLSAVGFEFKMKHSLETCLCDVEVNSAGGRGKEEENEGIAMADDKFDNDPIGGFLDESQSEWKVGDYRSQNSSLSGTGDGFDGDQSTSNNSYTVPIGVPINVKNNNTIATTSAQSVNRKTFSRNASNVSLFSLATHHTVSSTSSSSNFDDNDDYEENICSDDCVLRLYHVPSGNTLITSHNFHTFIADGVMYDEISRLCMEYAQEVMIKEAGLKWETICEERNIRALVSSKYYNFYGTAANSNNNYGNTDQNYDEVAQFDENNCSSKTRRRMNNSNNTLIIITGKGKVGAGIFSRRHIITTGLEPSTAIPFVREATTSTANTCSSNSLNENYEKENDDDYDRNSNRIRDMNIIILDPNVNTDRCGMETVEKSLDYFFFSSNNKRRRPQMKMEKQQNGHHYNDSSNDDHDENIYILAHSMAGAQIVRILHDKYKKEKDEEGNNDNIVEEKKVDYNQLSEQEQGINLSTTGDRRSISHFVQNRIKSIVFTDSNHNINWIKNKATGNNKQSNNSNAILTEKIEGPTSLYIKSHKVHDSPKQVGEIQHPNECKFWTHRFGKIKTLWAGTHEHSLTNYTAKLYIWNHFDKYLNPNDNTANGCNHEEEESKQS